jgi:hypothetical protein
MDSWFRRNDILRCSLVAEHSLKRTKMAFENDSIGILQEIIDIFLGKLIERGVQRRSGRDECKGIVKTLG